MNIEKHFEIRRLEVALSMPFLEGQNSCGEAAPLP